jgi:16S rRNA (adenine1518-N6/adenine1519-N6)-dimethyltransferase
VTEAEPSRQIKPRRVSLLGATRDLLRRSGLKSKKSLGQNFLIDEEVLADIVSAATISPGDVVLEVGPGLGVLTNALYQRGARVVSVELDDDLAAMLAVDYRDKPEVTVIHRDILSQPPDAFLKEALGELPASYKVVANLPYYITGMVLRHLLAAALKPATLLVMLQREVAEAVTARPEKQSLLSLSVRFYGEPFLVRNVSANSFYPVPKVNSALLGITLFDNPAVVVPDIEDYFKLIKDGFSAPRKQLANSLAKGLCLPRSEVTALLERAGIEPSRRPGNLNLEEWASLHAALGGKATC